MNAHQKIHQIQLNEWATRIQEQAASGLTAKDWCQQHNLSIHKYNYWKRLLKEQIADQVLPDIVPLPLSAPIVSPPADITPVSNSHICLPESNSANSTNRTNCNSISLTINGIPFELSPDVPENFLCSLIKAVRNA